MPDQEGRLRAIADFLARLTPTRVVLGLLFALGSVAVYALWETRGQWAIYLWQSQALLLSLLVGGVLVAVGAALQSQQKRGDIRMDTLYAQMRDQLNDMRREIELQRADRTTERMQLQHEIDELTERDRACQDRLREISVQLADLKRRTGFGELKP